jgi:hypothetical protein
LWLLLQKPNKFPQTEILYPVAKVDSFVAGFFFLCPILIGEQVRSSVWFVATPEEFRGDISRTTIFREGGRLVAAPGGTF